MAENENKPKTSGRDLLEEKLRTVANKSQNAGEIMRAALALYVLEETPTNFGLLEKIVNGKND